MSRQVGRYSVLGQLGRGAMGVVYLAEDPLLNRKVAIKTVDLSVEDDAERKFLLDRLLRDARAAAALSHPNIVSVYDVLREEGMAYLVMEFVEGESLASRLKDSPRPGPEFIAGVLRQMAAALDYTHARGIIHRDVKPGNVMLDRGGTAKIMDFGIARIADTRTSTPTGMVVGTVEYMAPEQIKGEPLDGRADQFSLAAVAYRMMAGGTMFGQQTLATLTYKMVNEMPEPVRTRNAAIPPAVDTVLSRALAKSPSERYATCSEFVEALDRALSGKAAEPVRAAAAAAVPGPRDPAPAAALATAPAPPSEPDAPPAPLVRPQKRGLPLWVAPGAAMVVLAVGVAVWSPWQRATVPPPSASPATPAAVRPPDRSAGADRPVAAAEGGHTVKPAPRSEAPQPNPVAGEEKESPPAQPPDLAIEADPTPVPEPVAQVYRQGQDQLKAGDYQGALQSFTKALAIQPGFARAYHNRGLAHQFLGENETAEQDYTEAIRLAPQDAQSYADRAVCRVRMRQDDQAFGDFNHALELRPDLAEALNGRGGILLRRQQYDQAIRDFTAAIRIKPQFALAYQNRARAERAMGDTAAANADHKRGDELRLERALVR